MNESQPTLEFWSLPEDALVIDDVRTNVDENIFCEKLRELLLTLTEREQKVLRARFWNQLTLKQCGNLLGITGSRVRQIESKAIRRLRHPSRSDIIEKYGPEWISISRVELNKRWAAEALESKRKQQEKEKNYQEFIKNNPKVLHARNLIEDLEYINSPHPEKCPANIILEFTSSGSPYLATFYHGGYFNRNMDPDTYNRWLNQLLIRKSSV